MFHPGNNNNNNKLMSMERNEQCWGSPPACPDAISTGCPLLCILAS